MEIKENKERDLNGIIAQIQSLENLGDNRTMDQDTILDELIEKAEIILYA